MYPRLARQALTTGALLGALVLRCASSPAPDPATVVRSYLSARTLDQALSGLAAGYHLWFGSRSGEGLDRARVATMLEWDYALTPRHRIDTMDVRGREVVARVHEDNDFSLLIGFPGWDATSTFVLDDAGRIASQVYVPAGPAEWRPYLDAPLAWIQEHRPEVLPRIFPDGKLARSGEAARDWVAVLREWRTATGRPDPTR